MDKPASEEEMDRNVKSHKKREDELVIQVLLSHSPRFLSQLTQLLRYFNRFFFRGV